MRASQRTAAPSACATRSATAAIGVTSAESTASILHSKLTTAKASITIAEQRAEAACKRAEAATRESAAKLEAMERTVASAQLARRRAEEERDAACAPPPDRLAHVRALEMRAYEAKKAHTHCAPDDPRRSGLEDEAQFRDALARQARHCLENGLSEAPRACHLHLGRLSPSPRQSTGANPPLEALGEALGRILSERAPPASATGASLVRRRTSEAAEARCNQYLDAVCTDLKAGLEASTQAYAAAKAAAPTATHK